jgi:hypothetical protein
VLVETKKGESSEYENFMKLSIALYDTKNIHFQGLKSNGF